MPEIGLAVWDFFGQHPGAFVTSIAIALFSVNLLTRWLVKNLDPDSDATIWLFPFGRIAIRRGHSARPRAPRTSVLRRVLRARNRRRRRDGKTDDSARSSVDPA
jgi:hypothetical protein